MDGSMHLHDQAKRACADQIRDLLNAMENYPLPLNERGVYHGSWKHDNLPRIQKLGDLLHQYASMVGAYDEDLWKTVCRFFNWNIKEPGQGDREGTGDWLALALSVNPDIRRINMTAKTLSKCDFDGAYTEIPLAFSLEQHGFKRYTLDQLKEYAAENTGKCRDILR